MKRYIKRYINWLIKKKEPEEVIGYIMGGTLGIILGIIFFITADKVPATRIDYYQLEKIAIDVHYNPGLLKDIDCEINIKNGIIKVTYESDECWLFAKYNKNFKILETSKKDKCLGWIGAFALAVVLGIGITGIGQAAISLILGIMGMFISLIYKILRAIKFAIKR